jgi:hypothetical protein
MMRTSNKKDVRRYSFEVVGSQLINIKYHGDKIYRIRITNTMDNLEETVDRALSNLRDHVINNRNAKSE